jgi:hypothetical protein
MLGSGRHSMSVEEGARETDYKLEGPNTTEYSNMMQIE